MERERLIWDGKPVEFEKRLLLDDRVSMWMPKDFQKLSEERIKELYPLPSMPELVFGNSYLDLFVGFRYTEHELSDSSVSEFSAIVRLMLEQTGPQIRILSEKTVSVGAHTVASLDLTAHVSAKAAYHKLFFCSLEGKALMGFINFPCSYDYQAVAQEMFLSLQITDK